MGHHTARKAAFVTTLAAAAMAIMLAASDSIALEATEIGPGPAGQGVSPAIAGKGEGPWAKAGSTLRRVFAAQRAHQQAGGDAPFKPDNPSVQFAKGLILIDAVAASNGAALLEDLRGLGLAGGTQYGAVVSGRIPLGLLDRVVGLESLRGVSASLKPETNSAIDSTFGLVHDRRAAIAMSLIASEADPQTYTGEGIKVGVLSDTFDNNGFPDYDGDGWPDMPATFADDDIANGDLPGGGAYVALHTPGNVDDDDRSAFAAVGTSGSNATIDHAEFVHDRAQPDPDGSIRFDPVSFDEEPVTAVVSYPDAPHYTIGESAFTMEGWFKFAEIGDGIKGPTLASHYATTGDQRAWWLVAGGQNEPNPPSNTNQLLFLATSDGTFNAVATARFPFAPVPNVWYHIAISRDETNDLRAFVNGQQVGVTINYPIDILDSTAPLWIGGLDNIGAPGRRPFDGWMEDFRMVVGEAVYTSNFAPPGPLASSLPPSTATTNVVDDTGNPGIDEGRAMMQLIHDVAPDASVSFHTAFNGMADFAQGIQDLADDGADIIVDDIIYFAEPMFQDGIVAQAVDDVVAQGKAYFSSAGNAAQHSYESPFVASGERLTVKPFIGPNEPRGMLHDFDPGVGVDWKQSVTIPEGTVFTLVAQWDQPFASNCPGCPGSQNDVDIYLVDDNDTILTSSIADNLASGDPVEILQLQNTGGIGTSFHIMMTHYDVVTAQHPDPGSPPTLMKYVWFGQSAITVNEFTTDSPSSYGHANAAGAAAVGAAFYLDTPAFGVSPPQRESFSSQGGVPILFDVSGNSLGVPGPREKPEFVAPDGTNTTFFYRDTGLDDVDEAPEAFPNFFGTSAAAPHAAAVAALMLEANPTLTPGDIYLILENTAVDMAAAGFDFDTGYGLIDATAAIAQATGGNLVPLAENDAASTNQNTLVSIPVLANDALGNQTTNITNVTDPQFGSAVINGTSIDYTPDTDLFGPDSFNYTITDNDGETSDATVNVMVNEIDVQPLAAEDNAATDEDTLLAGIDLMANDDPLGNAPTTITAAGPGKLGSTVTIAPDGGSISYDPAPNDSGIDVFPYTITDADGDFADANITVTINPVNDAPVADNDPTSTDEDTPAGFDDALMLAGDTDVENDPLSVTVVSGISFEGGTVTGSGGNYTYTPPANFNGNDAVNYVVSDGTDTDTGTVTITVNPVNDAPDAGSVANQNNQDGDAGISVDAATTDIENDTLTYSIGGQPAGLSINANTGEITGTIDGNASQGGVGGIYTVTVTASDASLGTDYQFTWTVSSGPVPNVPPTAAAGPDQNVADSDGVAGESVTLDGSGSSDSDGTVASYAWSWTGGGSAVGVGPVVNLPDGTTVVSLVVTDNDGTASTADTVSITVAEPNAPPTAAAGPDQNVADSDGVAGESVTLDGNGSSDSDGTVASYAWSWTGGGNAVGVSPLVNLPDGTTVVSLVVTDNDGAASTADTVSITVNAANTIPADPSNVAANNLADGSAQISWTDNSGNEDGFEIQREKQNKKGAWRATNIIATTGANATGHIDASGNGTFRYRVRATNGSGASGWSTPWAEVTVTTGGGGGNAAPTASFTHSCTGLDCDFDGSGSSDSDGTIASYSWDFGDGSPAGSGAIPNHIYAAAGTYTVILTVTDDLGADGQDSQNVMVTEGGGGLTLSANGYKVKGVQTVDLTWSGAAGANVEVYFGGGLLTTTANDGAYTHNIGNKGGGSYEYQICETGGSPCSDPVPVVF